jgi:apolipoprotein N-acyltransferase
VLGTGLLLAVAYPPFGAAALAWIALVPLGWRLAGSARAPAAAAPLRPAAAFRAGYLTGLVFFGLALSWILSLSKVAVTVGWIMYPAWAAAAAYLAIYPALAAAAASFVHARLRVPIAIAWPWCWLACDWLRSQGELGFPWLHLGYSQAKVLPVLQIASLLGVSGVGVWVALVNGLVLVAALAARGGRRKAGVVALACAISVVALPWIAFAPRIPKLVRSGPPVGLVQGNVEGRLKWSGRHEQVILSKFLVLSRDAIARGAKFIIWPETATGSYLRQNLEHRMRLQAFVDSTGVAILTGYPDYKFTGPKTYDSWNAAGVFWPNTGLGEQYAKIHLVPFGERMPFQSVVPALGKADFGQAEWTPGTDATPVPTPLGPAGVLVCFESIFTDPARAEVLRGARFLVNVTNDEWFGKTGALSQHAAMSVFRAVEHRVPVARCANTGLTFFVDPWGRIVDSGPIFEDYVAVGALPVGPVPPGRTPFTDIGDVCGPLVGFGALALVIVSFARRRALTAAEGDAILRSSSARAPKYRRPR